jgi:CTP:molybdopterin cytidylyltransferase MocA
MGFPKALLRYREETFLDRLAGLFAARCSPVIVVLGAEAGRIRAAGTGRRHLRREPGLGARPDHLHAVRVARRSAGGRWRALHAGGSPRGRARHHRRFAGRGPRAALLRVPRYHGRRGHPIWFSRELMPEFLALPETGAARDVVRRHARKPSSSTSTTPASWPISTTRKPTAASPERAHEDPARHGPETRRRGAGAAAGGGDCGALPGRRSLRRAPARIARARARPPRRVSRPGALQSVQRPRVLGGERGDPRGPLHRHRAHCLHGPDGRHARLLVAFRRQVRDCFHPPGRRQHQPCQIRPGLRVGPLELRVPGQPLRVARRPRHPHSQQQLPR